VGGLFAKRFALKRRDGGEKSLQGFVLKAGGRGREVGGEVGFLWTVVKEGDEKRGEGKWKREGKAGKM